LLAIFAELAGARLALNEIADVRAGLLDRLFRGSAITRYNAEQVHDRLDPAVRPSVVLMNPPFSASPEIKGKFAEATMRHLGSARAREARLRCTPPTGITDTLMDKRTACDWPLGHRSGGRNTHPSVTAEQETLLS